jgi:hypothetical protein
MIPSVEHVETVVLALSPAPPVVPPLPSQSSSAPIKTAAEEKADTARRRAEMDARGKEVATVSDEEDLPPSYPVPSSASTAPTSAADEKAELERCASLPFFPFFPDTD